jgi:hypothetical protein
MMPRKPSRAGTARLVLSVAVSFGLLAVPATNAQAMSSTEVWNRPAICLREGKLYTERSVIAVGKSYFECRSDSKWHSLKKEQARK